MAAAGGITLTWDDFAALATVTPLLCHIYPSGKADVNHFHAAGGTGFVIRELLEDGLLHEDVQTVMGTGLAAYANEPRLNADKTVSWVQGRGKKPAMRLCCGAGKTPSSRPADWWCWTACSAAR